MSTPFLGWGTAEKLVLACADEARPSALELRRRPLAERFAELIRTDLVVHLAPEERRDAWFYVASALTKTIALLDLNAAQAALTFATEDLEPYVRKMAQRLHELMVTAAGGPTATPEQLELTIRNTFIEAQRLDTT